MENDKENLLIIKLLNTITVMIAWYLVHILIHDTCVWMNSQWEWSLLLRGLKLILGGEINLTLLMYKARI